jgi:hypothetical protein
MPVERVVSRYQMLGRMALGEWAIFAVHHGRAPAGAMFVARELHQQQQRSLRCIRRDGDGALYVKRDAWKALA